MKRFLKALPVIMIGGLTLTGCGSVDVDLHVKDKKTADLTIEVEAPKKAIKAYVKKSMQQQQQQQGSTGQESEVPKGATAGYLLQSNLSSLRPVMGEPSKVTSKETNHGDNSKATVTLHDLKLDDLSQTGEQVKSPISVSYNQDRYKFTLTPAQELLKSVDHSEFTIHLPRAVESATAGGEVEGHSVTWDLKKVKSGQTMTAVSEGPGLPWWASLLIWLGGVAVTVLLIIIALMPGGKPEEDDVKAEGGPDPKDPENPESQPAVAADSAAVAVPQPTDETFAPDGQAPPAPQSAVEEQAGPEPVSEDEAVTADVAEAAEPAESAQSAESDESPESAQSAESSESAQTPAEAAAPEVADAAGAAEAAEATESSEDVVEAPETEDGEQPGGDEPDSGR